MIVARLKLLYAARWPLLPLFAVWLAVVLWLAASHVFWHDEVRALSIATSGATVADMLAVLHGDGHPALWYLLLRGGHALIGDLALPVTALLIAVAAAALMLWRAPFTWPVKALILFSKFTIFEYAVMARNYGISMLLMFAFAALYQRWRNRGIGLGLILLLLANTNVHSALLAAALMAVWLADAWRESGWRWGPPVRLAGLNAALVLAGAALCAATVWPPFNDAATDLGAHGGAALLRAIAAPGQNFGLLMPGEHMAGQVGWLRTSLMSVLLVLAALGLWSRPVLMTVALGSLLAMSVLFSMVYPGGYRHQALWLVLLITLYWLAGTDQRRLPAASSIERYAIICGSGAAVVLLGLQVMLGIGAVRRNLVHPQGASKLLAQLISATPALQQATIVADPDYLIEPLPYYLGNPLYQLRLPLAKPIIPFTKHARLQLTLDDILATAQQLHRERRTPVVILMQHPVDPAEAATTIKEGYNWTLVLNPASAARFTAATSRLALFEAVSSDEHYAVYRLRD